MTKEELQKRIEESIRDAKGMREIGEVYWRGDVLRDPVAAEAWLMKAIEQDDPLESDLAMAFLVKKILGKDQIISDMDYQTLKEEREKIGDKPDRELELLISFATEKQKNG